MAHDNEFVSSGPGAAGTPGKSQPADAPKQVERRRYEPPRVLSAEPLEAVAAACAEDGAGGVGKSVPFPCAEVLGS